MHNYFTAYTTMTTVLSIKTAFQETCRWCVHRFSIKTRFVVVVVRLTLGKYRFNELSLCQLLHWLTTDITLVNTLVSRMFLKPPGTTLGKQFQIKLFQVHCDAPELSGGEEGTAVH